MAKNSLRPVIVSDSGPLIHLELESLELLADFSVWVPKKVEEEVANYRPDIFQRFQSFLIQRDIPPRLPPNLYQLAKALSLGPGEISALSLMEDNPAAIFLTDDAAARLAAQILG